MMGADMVSRNVGNQLPINAVYLLTYLLRGAESFLSS